MDPCAALPRPRLGFTLIELLVVVTIIVVLLALLVPAMDKAIYVAEKATCLVNQRSLVQGCQFYATDNRQHWPNWPNNEQPSAYDWRTPWNIGGTATTMQAGFETPGVGPLKPAGFGMLVGSRLPTTQLGKVAHCPSIDNTSSPYPGVGMDQPWLGNWGAGGSYWVDPAWNNRRILGSYNYRAASWFHAGKGWIRSSKVGSGQIMSIDMPDMRFGGRQYIHPDGWNRTFADGHGSFYLETAPIGQSEVEQRITAYTAGTNDVAGDRPERGVAEEEQLYPYLATQK